MRCVTGREIITAGAAVIIAGTRKRKCTIVRGTTGEILREDYSLDRIKDDLLTGMTGEKVPLEQRETNVSMSISSFGKLGCRRIT